VTVADDTEAATSDMTGAEVRTIREQLGLSKPCLAHWLRTDERTLERFESGEWPVLKAQEDRLEELLLITDELVRSLADEARNRLKDLPEDAPAPTLLTFRNDSEHDIWANQIAKAIVTAHLPSNLGADDVYEFQTRAVSLLRAGRTPEEVAKAIDGAVMKMPDGSRVPNITKMPKFPVNLPSRWHRHVCARVVDQVRDVAIDYVAL
jgi:hypothetical protein